MSKKELREFDRAFGLSESQLDEICLTLAAAIAEPEDRLEISLLLQRKLEGKTSAEVRAEVERILTAAMAGQKR